MIPFTLRVHGIIKKPGAAAPGFCKRGGKNVVNKLWGHFSTITHHKWLVMKYCFKLGLYRQGLCHDLSKYTPAEFWPGVRYYQGDRSPNDAQRQAEGCSTAWLHHKGRNRHHLEYLIDYDPAGTGRMIGNEMPVRYVAEMFCDRIAASRTYLKGAYTDASPWQYYERGQAHYLLHPATRRLLERMLLLLREEGEEKAFETIRREILQK